EIGEPLALSGDGAAAVFARGGLAVVTDTVRLGPVRFLDHDHPVRAAALSRDAALVATVDREGAVFLWAASSGKRLQKLAWSGEPVRAAVFTSDGKRLVAVGAPSFDTTVRVWSVDTGDSI